MIEKVWGVMAGFYGHKWGSSYGTDPQGVAGDAWAAGLAGLSGVQIAAGLETIMRGPDTWPPSLQEFRAICLGIPSFAEVVPQLAPGFANPSPFVRVVWRYLDPYALRLANVGADRTMMRDAYELASRYVLAGGALPPECRRIEHDPTAEARLYDRLHAERMREFVATPDTPPNDDPSPAANRDE